MKTRFIYIFVSILGIISTRANAADTAARIDRNIDAGWKFIRSDVPGAETAAFDDAAWQGVDLPHTYNVTDGGLKNYYRGPAWYRLHLNIGPELAGRSLFLRFGAATLVAQVYVNGQSAGTHEGGFAAFCFDISKLAHAGDNIVAVRVDNKLNPNITPLSGDFTVYGGLNREVHLLALSPVSVSPIDDASPGVYFKTAVADAAADVDVTAKLRNSSDKDAGVTVTYSIINATGQTVAGKVMKEIVPANSAMDAFAKNISVQNPHLWNGRSDPYLYKAVVEVKQGDTVLDHVEQQIGFRYFSVDSDKGLMLNGKPYDMHGVNYHQGRPSVGFASTHEMMEEDFNILADLGITGVRMAHYQHGDYEHTLCDQKGIIVWSELALVNRLTDSPEFRASAEQQLREMIKQAYNHPSIFFWSMYNEPNLNTTTQTQARWHLVADLVAEAHQLDPTRLTTGAAADGTRGDILWYMDVTGMNRYWGWYSGGPELWAQRIQQIHTQNPGKSIGISEYGAGGSVKQHELNPKQPKTGGPFHPEEWESVAHEASWQAMADKPWIWCKLVWCAFDFGSAGRNEGDTPGINDKGLVTADRKTEKDVYFYYKANWTTEPFVYVTDRRFDPHPAGTCDLKVYSNCDSAELWLNGKSLGSKTSTNHIFVWPGADIPEGATEIKATGTAAGKAYSDAISWKVVKQTTTQPTNP